MWRCFPHIVNLACKAILAAISSLDFNPMPLDGEDDDEDQTFLDKLTEDPIGRLRVLIRVVSFFFFQKFLSSYPYINLDSSIIYSLTLLFRIVNKAFL